MSCSAVIDKYTAGIEVSNACRKFYVSRLKTAETLKERLSSGNSDLTDSNGQPASTFQASINHLRKELASLIDTDLQVMRQLLMLNEQVEELKWRRRNLLSSAMTPDTIDESDGSDADRLWSRAWSCDPCDPDSWSADLTDHDYCNALSKYPTPSALSLFHGSTRGPLSTRDQSLDALDKGDSDVFHGDAQEQCQNSDTFTKTRNTGRPIASVDLDELISLSSPDTKDSVSYKRLLRSTAQKQRCPATGELNSAGKPKVLPKPKSPLTKNSYDNPWIFREPRQETSDGKSSQQLVQSRQRSVEGKTKFVRDNSVPNVKWSKNPQSHSTYGESFQDQDAYVEMVI